MKIINFTKFWHDNLSELVEMDNSSELVELSNSSEFVESYIILVLLCSFKSLEIFSQLVGASLKTHLNILLS